MLDSVIRVNKKYYLQTLLEECKYEIRIKWGILNDHFDLSSSDESDNESDNESDSEPDSEPDNESDNNKSNDEFEN